MDDEKAEERQVMDIKTLSKLGYKSFGYADQRDLVARASAQGWAGPEPSVLGTYSGDKAVEEAANFLLAYLEGK